MNNILSFGKHKGKTFEWLFFNKPSYAEFIYDNDIHYQRGRFSIEEGGGFLELFRRASCLGGICRWCKQRPMTRMGISSLLVGGPNHLGCYCEECEYPEPSVTEYGPPSFFVETDTMFDGEQKLVAAYIKNRYVGPHQKLTQAKMEEFFYNDSNFVRATPGFFAREAVTV